MLRAVLHRKTLMGNRDEDSDITGPNMDACDFVIQGRAWIDDMRNQIVGEMRDG